MKGGGGVDQKSYTLIEPLAKVDLLDRYIIDGLMCLFDYFLKMNKNQPDLIHSIHDYTYILLIFFLDNSIGEPPTSSGVKGRRRSGDPREQDR